MAVTKRGGKAPPDPWRFLQPWFNVLSRFVSIADPCRYDTHEVRLGREPHDWRIRFDFVSDEDEGKPKQQIQRLRKTREALILTSVPVFSLDGISLNLRSFKVHAALLTELRRLVEVGVHITSLSLPEAALVTEDVPSEEFLSAWVALVRAVSGHGTRPTHVNRLILPFWYCREPYLSAFCSALPTARRLRFVRLEKKKKESGYRWDDESEIVEEKLGKLAASERMWTWLGCGVFHPSTSSSVEALSVQVVDLREEELNRLEIAMDIQLDPLWFVWRGEAKMLDSSEEISRRREVTVMKGTTLQLTDELNNGKSIVTHESLPAIVMMEDEDSTSQPLDVLIPGFGFCQVDQSNLQNKKPRQQRVGTNYSSAASVQAPVLKSCLSTLLLEVGYGSNAEDDSGDADGTAGGSDDGGDIDSDGKRDETKAIDRSGALLSRLMALVGRQLTSLSLASTALDDNTLAACLDACPAVRNLRLRHVKLKTMHAITRFHVQGRRIRSLELHDFKIPDDVLNAFLRTVADDRNDVYRLERLCLAQLWGKQYRKSTVDALKHLLEANKRLAQVQIFRAEDFIFTPGFNLPIDRVFESFRGNAVHIPMDESSRLAFLSVLRPANPSSDHGPRTQLTEEIVQNVLEFAASSGRRIVIQDRDHYRDKPFR